MTTIADKALEDVAHRLHDNHDMKLDISPLTRQCVAERGFDIRYGARPMKRAVARDVLNPLSRLLLDGGVRERDVVCVRTRGEAEKMIESGRFSNAEPHSKAGGCW
mmetsp:Transcript_3379/g.5736  ORF Transcript_3379/g.5736 Transcript_3379/m.5736 type:complete len:106 (+) Transcript_3379:550-867(+)